MTPLHVLQQRFGYTAFRLEQEAIIQSVLQGRDTFALMPTGGGKSLCYQIPALLMEGLTLVISPLIALMKDQVDALRLNGIPAAYLNSTQSTAEQDDILGKIHAKELKLLYLSPERLLRGDREFLNKIATFNLSLIAIDEAHCISHWGHDFRPEYLMLAQLKQQLPHVPVIALTATADRLTRKDIIDKLELKQPATFVASFNRPNIRYSVQPKKDSFPKLLDFLSHRQRESGIIYCLSRASTERLAADLNEAGYAALPYHAGLDKAQRAAHQEKFLRDEVNIIVATIAFGMGIDKSNVRFVVHMDLPKNVESYYQETGRAGRDGLESEALLFYAFGDVVKMKRFVEIENNPDQTAIYLRKLQQMGAYGDLRSCRRKFLLNYFDENASAYCGNCDVCLTCFEQFDGTAQARIALTAVRDLNELYGSGFLVDFLRGSQTEKIRPHQRRHPSYGSGRDYSRESWKQFFTDLVRDNYLEKTRGLYPVLKLTEKGHAVLDENTPALFTKSKERMEAVAEPAAAYERDLFEKLRVIRQEIALLENVPAYIVLSDATLRELATYLPRRPDEIRKISGFSGAKADRYGEHFRVAVANYCRDHNIPDRMPLRRATSATSHRLPSSDTRQQSYALFMQGLTIEEIAASRGLKTGTIETHLGYFIRQGALALEQVLPLPKIKAIEQAIDDTGVSSGVAALKVRLGDDVGYGEIRMVIARREFLQQSAHEEALVT